MFIAIRGFKNDGTEYILDAIKKWCKSSISTRRHR